MRLLVNGASSTMLRLCERVMLRPHLGHLYSPACGNALQLAANTMLPAAADNGCFNGFDRYAFLRYLDKLVARPSGCELLWCVAPDVVADADATRDLYDEWEPQLRERGFKVAYVAQDGLHTHIEALPWDRIDCLFVGGSTEFKLGPTAQAAIKIAKRRGKWVHVGRVNTLCRLRRFHALGVDSVDGTSMSMFPDTHITRFAWLLRRLDLQYPLPLTPVLQGAE